MTGQWLDGALGVLGAGTSAATLKVIWINVQLSCDNAVVIALACRRLPPGRRALALAAGAAAAIATRIALTLGVASLVMAPWLQAAGSLILLAIAVRLLTVESAGAADVPAAAGVLGAVPTIAIADIVMSPDNVLAVAAAAQGAWGPIVVGLLVSMPLVAACATLILALLARLPVLVWAGAGLIGWIAGELLLADPAIRPAVETLARSHGTTTGTVEIAAAGLGALLVVAAGRVLQRRRS